MKKLIACLFGLLWGVQAHAVVGSGYVAVMPDNTTLYPQSLNGWKKRVITNTDNLSNSGLDQDIALFYLEDFDNKIGEPVPGVISNTLKAATTPSWSKNDNHYFETRFQGSVAENVKSHRWYLRLDMDHITITSAKEWLGQNPTTVLYLPEIATDNVYIAAKRTSDNAFGYYCESGTNSGDFVVAYGMTGTVAPTCPSGQVLQTYTSATGTVTQSPDPTPSAPVTPTFYTQGSMVLRKLNNTYYDSYDATTGKITRRVGVITFNGTEDWKMFQNSYYSPFTMTTVGAQNRPLLSTHFANIPSVWDTTQSGISATSTNGGQHIYVQPMLDTITNADTLKQYLAQQKAAGTPVTVYYPLETPVEEDWASEQCESTNPIKIATTKYNAARFDPLVQTLNAAVQKIRDVVSTTIEQTKAVADLQSGKQQRPSDTACPQYRQCLLVEDSNGTPHWYEIMDPFYNLFAAVIPNNVNASGVTSVDDTYTQLDYIESSGTQYIDTNIAGGTRVVIDVLGTNRTDDWVVYLFGELNSTSYQNGFTQYKTAWTSGGSVEIRNTFDVSYSPSGINVNGVQTSGRTIANNANLGLFGSVSANRRINGAKVYSAKIYNGATLLRDFIPARRNRDNHIGLYDKVSGGFFESVTETAFIPGNVVLPTDVPTEKAWTMSFGANAPLDVRYEVTGSVVCNATSGTANTAATSTQMTNANWTASGNYCWCSIDSVTDQNSNSSAGKNIWVWLAVPSGETCASNCAENCATEMQSGTNTDFRHAMTGI